jgi:hypothetical protein
LQSKNQHNIEWLARAVQENKKQEEAGVEQEEAEATAQRSHNQREDVCQGKARE